MLGRRAAACLLVVALALAGSQAGRAASATNKSVPHVLTFQQERMVRCSAPGAVKFYDKTGSCVRLGHVVLGPGAFTLARRLPDGAMGSIGGTPRGPWVEIVISPQAKAVMMRALTDPYGHPDGSLHRFDFVFDSHPLRGEIGGDGVSVFLLAPNARTARSIVGLVCHEKDCSGPFPGPTG